MIERLCQPQETICVFLWDFIDFYKGVPVSFKRFLVFIKGLVVFIKGLTVSIKGFPVAIKGFHCRWQMRAMPQEWLYTQQSSKSPSHYWPWLWRGDVWMTDSPHRKLIIWKGLLWNTCTIIHTNSTEQWQPSLLKFNIEFCSGMWTHLGLQVYFIKFAKMKLVNIFVKRAPWWQGYVIIWNGWRRIRHWLANILCNKTVLAYVKWQLLSILWVLKLEYSRNPL